MDMNKPVNIWTSEIRLFLFNTELLHVSANPWPIYSRGSYILWATPACSGANSPFWHSSLFKSQLVKEGEDFLLKKGTSKDSQALGIYQNKPFRGPHNKKRGSYRKRPYGGNTSQSSNQSFTLGRGKPNFTGSRVHFRPHSRGEGHGNRSPNDSLKASLIPPVGGRLRSFRRDCQTNKCSSNVLNIITNGYVLPFISKPSLVRFPLIQSESDIDT